MAHTIKLRHIIVAVTFASLLAACPNPSPVSVNAEASLVSLAPPPEGQGVQLRVGPFDVPRGGEVQKNFFLKLPVDQAVLINRIQIAYPKGSHHCNIFKSDNDDAPDHVVDTFDAVPYELYDMFAASQTGDFDWTLPEGVGIALKARHQLIIQTHFVNAATQKTPGDRGEVKVNLWFAQPEAIQHKLGMLFAINRNLDIPPHSTSQAQKTIDLARHGITQDVNVLAMTGHFHSRGKTFEITRWDGATAGETIYKSDNWDEPPFKRFEPPMVMKVGEQLRYTTTFVNDSEQTVTFGPYVETQEHSNLFMYFYPGPEDGKALYDFEPGTR